MMGSFEDGEFNLKSIQNKFGILQRDINNCGIPEGELKNIDHYKKNIFPNLEKI